MEKQGCFAVNVQGNSPGTEGLQMTTTNHVLSSKKESFEPDREEAKKKADPAG